MSNAIDDGWRDFVALVERITSRVRQCVEQGLALEQRLDGESTPIYLKSSDTRVLYANAAYRAVFAADALPTGRSGEAYLQETIVPISQSSDRMVLRGCSSVMFDHFGHSCDGQPMLFRSAKRSLLSVGHPAFAILGITSVRQVLERDSESVARAAWLAEKWNRLMELDAEDRELAIALARGMSTHEIAEQRGISRRTVENHRHGVLVAMDVPSQLELIKLLVRLQEKGFGDLGV